MSALLKEGHSDYLLKPVENSVWITVDYASVYVRRVPGGVAVDIYPLGDEMGDAIASTTALYDEEDYEHQHQNRDDGRGTSEDWSKFVRQGQDGKPRRPKGGSQ